MRLCGRFLPLPPAPVSLCIRRGRAVSGAQPQHYRTAAPPHVFRRDDPPRNGEPVRPAGSLRSDPLEGGGGATARGEAALMHGLHSSGPPPTPAAPGHSDLLSSGARGAATTWPRSPAPCSCAAPPGPLVPVGWGKQDGPYIANEILD
ncbi:hypothetical protein NDU88_002057 [Pleurodeles waltl]|uniref:Uncharacterized protein n=1 Tax=Pleurodeles waltl TaxID=8319 RepID=A0AAV7T1G6_PLEWA|nr:hypothetical protein NDU88_002057 [Pleurodeles waltl]